MKEPANNKKSGEKKSGHKRRMDQYYSVEFSINGLSVPRQFKIWNIPPTAMCFLVKENSNILRGLRVGDTLRMKYYSANSAYPSDYMETAIRHIGKNDQERFKKHYLVGLEIVEGQDQRNTH
jgi:hypothetical protein